MDFIVTGALRADQDDLCGIPIVDFEFYMSVTEREIGASSRQDAWNLCGGAIVTWVDVVPGRGAVRGEHITNSVTDHDFS